MFLLAWSPTEAVWYLIDGHVVGRRRERTSMDEEKVDAAGWDTV